MIDSTLRTSAGLIDAAGAVAAMQHFVFLLTPLCVQIRVAAVFRCADTVLKCKL